MSHLAEAPPQNNPCPRCGGDRDSLETQCGSCKWRPGATRLPPAKQVIVTFQMLVTAAKTTSISSLFLVTAIVAACVAAGTQQFVLGMLASVISLFAIARTSLFVLYSKAAGEPISFGHKIEKFITNFVLMAIFLAAAVICFATFCVSITVTTHNFILGNLLAFCFSLALFLWFLWLVPAHRR